MATQRRPDTACCNVAGRIRPLPSLVIIPTVMLDPCPFEEPHFAPARPSDMTRQRPAGIALPSHQCKS